MTDSQPGSPKPATDGSRGPAGLARALWAGPGSSRRIVLIVLALCLCVAAAGVTVAVLSSPGSQAGHIAAGSSRSAAKAAQPKTEQPAVPAASSPAATGAKVTSDGVAKSALGYPPRLKNQIQRWWEGPGGSALALVEKQLGIAMQAAGIKNYPVMKLTCVSLLSEIRTAQAAPPIPDRAMQRLYAGALAGLSSAAADCQKAISEHR